MMRKNKLIALLLLMSMLTGMTVSCSDAESGTETADVSAAETEAQAEEAAGANVPEETEPEEIVYRADVPEASYDGREFRVFTRGEATGKFWHRDLWAEMNGEVLNDAVYKRNLAVEEALDIKITPVWSDTADMATKAATSVTANDNAFDVIMAPLNQLNSLSTKDMTLDLLSDVPHLNLEQPWWDANSVRDLSIGGKLYYTYGDFTIMDEETTWIIYFNKDIQKNLQMEDFYELVETGKWTNDKFYSLSQAATYDLDGDGDLDTDDMYGYLGETYNITVSLIASDVFTVQKDENDIPVMLEDKTRMFEALESALTYMNDTNATLIDYRDGLEALERLQKYRDNEALFTMCGMINVIQFRDLVTDFGILPIPKLDEAQEEYYSTVSYVNADAMSVPTTATDLEMIGIVMETFSAESRNTVLPAYYEVALTRKATRDEESRHMIDLIIEGKRYDIGMLLDLGGIYTEVQNMVSNKKTDVASMWASIEKRMAKNLEKMFG